MDIGFEAIQTTLAVILAFCGGVVGVAGMVAVVVRFWKWAHKDTDKNTEDISEFRAWLGSDKRRIETLEKQQSDADRQNRLMLRAMVSLLDHEIDGQNHIDKLMAARDAIDKYLIEEK